MPNHAKHSEVATVCRPFGTVSVDSTENWNQFYFGAFTINLLVIMLSMYYISKKNYQGSLLFITTPSVLK